MSWVWCKWLAGVGGLGELGAVSEGDVGVVAVGGPSGGPSGGGGGGHLVSCSGSCRTAVPGVSGILQGPEKDSTRALTPTARNLA